MKARFLAELLSMQLDGLMQTHERAREWMLEESKKVPVVRLLETAPGIGEIRAPLIVAIVISPHRLKALVRPLTLAIPPAFTEPIAMQCGK